jgi:geranylgeranyl pyrophosphate synthase
LRFRFKGAPAFAPLAEAASEAAGGDGAFVVGDVEIASLLREASAEVRRLISAELPASPSPTQMAAILGVDGRLFPGFDGRQIGDALLAPIREMVDRGGKAWRSLALLESLDAVGGDSAPFLPWLAIPELIHVGSLIIDDIEDSSEIRRGGAACHKIWGIPLAVNAGTAAYFLAEIFIRRVPLRPDLAKRVADLYFGTLRCGHAGQALDIRGLAQEALDAIESGQSALLIERIWTISRMKTGIPAAMAAKMGALAGGGTDAQVEELGTYFESVGLAFQIADDVLNLRGFCSHSKQRGEDLRGGKLTLPVARALERLDTARRRALAQALAEAPESPEALALAIELIEGSGALEVCLDEARLAVERAWARLDPCLSDSIHKARLRALGHFAVSRRD